MFENIPNICCDSKRICRYQELVEALAAICRTYLRTSDVAKEGRRTGHMRWPVRRSVRREREVASNEPDLAGRLGRLIVCLFTGIVHA